MNTLSIEDPGNAVNNEVILFSEPMTDPHIIWEAKLKELENFKKNNVFEEVVDNGEKCISVRWVFTDKYIDGKHSVKARLVARGFEETELMQTDSPTCSKESIRLMTSILVSKGWESNGIDVKAAFLQGKAIDRDVYIKPPPEFEKHNTLWKLNVCIYGLNDASRTWYLKVCEELLALGVTQCKNEPAMFYWHHEELLHGMICIHVDDLYWGGSKIFKTKIIEGFKHKFDISKESSHSFKYLGLEIKWFADYVIIDQKSYVDALKPIQLCKERMTQKHLSLNSDELSNLRSMIGQLSWVGTQTRPDILFECSELASSLKSASVEHLLRANKVLKKLKDHPVLIKIPKLVNLEDCRFICYHDASYANLKDGGSQGSYIILMTDEINKLMAPIAWQSKRIKRVVKSTLAAETLSLVEAADASFWLQSVLNEILGTNKFNIECRSDSQSLCNAIRSSTALSEKRLTVDIAILREMLSKGEISEVIWVPASAQTADKRGASSEKLLAVLMNNELM